MTLSYEEFPEEQALNIFNRFRDAFNTDYHSKIAALEATRLLKLFSDTIHHPYWDKVLFILRQL